jgi:hypothetical protein
VIVDGIRIARELASSEPLAALIGAENGALAGLEGDALAAGIRRTHVHYYHPGLRAVVRRVIFGMYSYRKGDHHGAARAGEVFAGVQG